MKVKLVYCCNFNGWNVIESDLDVRENDKIEDRLPSVTYHLHDEDGENLDGLDSTTEQKVIEAVHEIVGADVEIDIEENFFDS